MPHRIEKLLTDLQLAVTEIDGFTRSKTLETEIETHLGQLQLEMPSLPPSGGTLRDPASLRGEV